MSPDPPLPPTFSSLQGIMVGAREKQVSSAREQRRVAPLVGIPLQTFRKCKEKSEA
jgi:hypothetical protein